MEENFCKSASVDVWSWSQHFLFSSGQHLVAFEVFTFQRTVRIIFVNNQKVDIVQLQVLQGILHRFDYFFSGQSLFFGSKNYKINLKQNFSLLSLLLVPINLWTNYELSPRPAFLFENSSKLHLCSFAGERLTDVKEIDPIFKCWKQILKQIFLRVGTNVRFTLEVHRTSQ